MEVSSHNNISAETQMEYDDILTQYMDLYNYDCNLFTYYFASNSVVDWFGRTIRGNLKINIFLRTEVCTAFEHLSFNRAHGCEPIENRPSHMKTQEIPIETQVPTETNKLKDKTSLKFYADSDVEGDDEENSEEEQTSKVEEDADVVMVGFGTLASSPSSSSELEKCLTTSRHLEQDFINSDDLEECLPTKSKRKKHHHTVVRKPYTRRRRTIQRSPFCMRTPSPPGKVLTDDKSSIPVNPIAQNIEERQIEYSPLKYFESTGTLRSLIQTTHRGFGGQRTPLRSEEWDREIRIRISYRIRLHDNHVQFALIIYENVLEPQRVSRRNLMNEFSFVANNEESSTLMPDDDRSKPITSENNVIMHQRNDNDSEAFRTPPATPLKKPQLKRTNISESEVADVTPAPALARTVKQKLAKSLRLF